MARYAPALSPTELDRMTPEQTRYLRRCVEAELKDEQEERLAIAKATIRAAGARLV
jgi:hypothetical protein